PSAPKCAHIASPMPPAAPVIATTLCLKSKFFSPRLLHQSRADPLEARLAQMPIIVEGELLYASAAKCGNGGNHRIAARKIRMRRPQNATQRSAAAQAAADVPGIGGDAGGACLVKTGLDRSRGVGQSAQVAPFVP